MGVVMTSPMTNSGFDPVSDARFRATVEAERHWTREQVGLLWHHMGKRRGELQRLDERLTEEITGVKQSINKFILWLALAVGGVLFSIVRAKLGL